MTIDPDPVSVLDTADGERLAYRRLDGKAPGVVFCPGFKSDMTGSKATALETLARGIGRAYVRFDYRGHGRSTGNFRDGTIGVWLTDLLAILDALSQGPQVLVGSSMGGWLALLAARARPDRVGGLVLVAPAPDFTEDLIWDRLSAEDRETLMRERLLTQPSDYDDGPYEITAVLIEEGRDHLLLRDTIAVTCPVRILHGMRDPDVPWRQSIALCEKLASDDVTLTLIKSGDHRLSERADLQRLMTTVESLCRDIEAVGK